MISNLKKYKQGLETLINKGKRLLNSIQKEYKSESDKKEQGAVDTNELLSFRDEYQSWYSESLAVIKQLVPDRKSDFIKYYEQPKNRQSIKYDNYRIEDYLCGLETNFIEPKKDSLIYLHKPLHYSGIAISQFRQQLAILKSAERRLKSSLFDIKQLLQADLFDTELSAAAELNKKDFIRPAGVITGVVLEGHLKEVCNKRKIEVKKKQPTINDLNQLLKDNEVIDTPTWRNIQRLADLRNLCAHKKSSEPKKEAVNEFIESVEKIIKTLF